MANTFEVSVDVGVPADRAWAEIGDPANSSSTMRSRAAAFLARTSRACSCVTWASRITMSSMGTTFGSSVRRSMLFLVPIVIFAPLPTRVRIRRGCSRLSSWRASRSHTPGTSSAVASSWYREVSKMRLKVRSGACVRSGIT